MGACGTSRWPTSRVRLTGMSGAGVALRDTNVDAGLRVVQQLRQLEIFRVAARQ